MNGRSGWGAAYAKAQGLAAQLTLEEMVRQWSPKTS